LDDEGARLFGVERPARDRSGRLRIGYLHWFSLSAPESSHARDRHAVTGPQISEAQNATQPAFCHGPTRFDLRPWGMLGGMISGPEGGPKTARHWIRRALSLAGWSLLVVGVCAGGLVVVRTMIMFGLPIPRSRRDEYAFTAPMAAATRWGVS
jgi:hypothetical protein